MLSSTLHRLNDLLRPDPALTYDDLVYLADMCPFDSQREGTEWKAWSPWCRLFDGYEWEILGYLKDVERYYEVGQGSVSLLSVDHRQGACSCADLNSDMAGPWALAG